MGTLRPRKKEVKARAPALGIGPRRGAGVQTVRTYTVKKGYRFPVPNWDVTNQTLPGCE